jgi:phenylalanyl-tRNA synthetase beta subunit
MLKSKVLVLELLAVDALPACSIASSEISTLDHELLDYSVEDATLVAEGLACLSYAFLAGAEAAEILCSFWDYIVVQLEGNSAFFLGADGDVEVDTTALGFFGHLEGELQLEAGLKMFEVLWEIGL